MAIGIWVAGPIAIAVPRQWPTELGSQTVPIEVNGTNQLDEMIRVPLLVDFAGWLCCRVIQLGSAWSRRIVFAENGSSEFGFCSH